MVKLYQDDNRKIYKEIYHNGNSSLFTMLNMSNYLSQNQDESDNQWFLMFRDDFDRYNKKIRHTEASIDSNGYYIKFVEKDLINNSTRYILSESDQIQDDYIIKYDQKYGNVKESLLAKKEFYYKNKLTTLNEYLVQNENDNNKRIIEYLSNNHILKKEISKNKGL